MRIKRLLKPGTNRCVSLLLFSVYLCSCVQKMGKEGHLRPLEGGPAFLMTQRHPPAGTVPQTAPYSDFTEKKSKPILYKRKSLEKGQEQYRAFCMPCHGMSGYGNGMIVQRGFLAPPSFHNNRWREVPDSHFFEVISHGYGAMYSYGDRVTPEDRWAIIGYIRALQFSQNADFKKLKAHDQRELRTLPPQGPKEEAK